MIADGLMQEFKDPASLLTAGGDGTPDAFAPLLPSHTACSQRNVAIQHDKPYRLLGEIIRWLQARSGDNAKIGICVLAETFRHVLVRFMFRGLQPLSPSVHHEPAARLSGTDVPIKSGASHSNNAL